MRGKGYDGKAAEWRAKLAELEEKASSPANEGPRIPEGVSIHNDEGRRRPRRRRADVGQL